MATQARNRGSPTADTRPAVWDSCASSAAILRSSRRAVQVQEHGQLLVRAHPRPPELEDPVVLVEAGVDPVLTDDGVQQSYAGGRRLTVDPPAHRLVVGVAV